MKVKAIVTGHSRGLGAAIAGNLLSRNISVLGLSRQKNKDLEMAYPDTIDQYELDLSDSAHVADWLANGVLSRFLSESRTVLLINNAGVVSPMGSLESQDPVAIARAVALNVAAPMMLASAVTIASPSANDRRIMHISSGAGRSAIPGWSIYCATKAALDHHARAAATDQTAGNRICSIAPGVIDTDMQTEIRAMPAEIFPIRATFDALKRDGALSAPAVCANNLVDFLLSSDFGAAPVTDLRE